MADIRLNKAEEVAAEVEALGAKALAVQSDVGQMEACESLLRTHWHLSMARSTLWSAMPLPSTVL